MRIKRLSALLLSALLITSPIGYMTVNGDTIDAKDYSQQVQSVDSAYIGSYIPSSLCLLYTSSLKHLRSLWRTNPLLARETRIFLRKTRRINNEGFNSKRKP